MSALWRDPKEETGTIETVITARCDVHRRTYVVLHSVRKPNECSCCGRFAQPRLFWLDMRRPHFACVRCELLWDDPREPAFRQHVR